MALLSVGELVAIDAHTLRAALWLHSSTSRNLTTAERAMLVAATAVNERALGFFGAARGDIDQIGRAHV